MPHVYKDEWYGWWATRNVVMPGSLEIPQDLYDQLLAAEETVAKLQQQVHEIYLKKNEAKSCQE